MASVLFRDISNSRASSGRRPSYSLFGDSFGPAPDHAVRELWLVIAAALALFALDYVLVGRGTSKAWDDDAILWIHARSTGGLDRAMRWVTNTGGVWRIVPVSAGAVFLWCTRRRLEMYTFLTAIAVAQATTYALKAIVQRDRPGLFDVANQPTDTSFPSGHALGSTVLGGFAAVWLWQHGHRGAAAVVVAWALVVSLSRVYLGAHHPTDVLASICLGVAFVGVTGLVYHHLHHRAASAR